MYAGEITLSVDDILSSGILISSAASAATSIGATTSSSSTANASVPLATTSTPAPTPAPTTASAVIADLPVGVLPRQLQLAGVQMKRYQLQALQWMREREKVGVLNDNSGGRSSRDISSAAAASSKRRSDHGSDKMIDLKYSSSRSSRNTSGMGMGMRNDNDDLQSGENKENWGNSYSNSNSHSDSSSPLPIAADLTVEGEAEGGSSSGEELIVPYEGIFGLRRTGSNSNSLVTSTSTSTSTSAATTTMGTSSYQSSLSGVLSLKQTKDGAQGKKNGALNSNGTLFLYSLLPLCCISLTYIFFFHVIAIAYLLSRYYYYTIL
jgi:hypothetical protein